MGWLGKFLDRLGGAAPEDMTIVQVATSEIPGIGQPLQPDECYVELYVESLRLKNARKLATEFNGIVYSFAGLSREGESRAEFAAVSKPEKLMELDSKSLDHVITVSKQMLAPVPWRGGVFSLELGLFSVKTGNLLTPILDYVTKVSSTAGISFVGVVKPFVPLITEGMDLIAGQKDDTAMEVAIDTDLSLATTGAYALIAAPKGSVSAPVSLDKHDHKLLAGGEPLEAAYCVFSIRSTKQKPDYGEIPELKEKYAAVQAAIKSNKMQEAKDALTAFRLATIASSDLISSDARRLVQKVEQKVADAFGPGGMAYREAAQKATKLKDIGLYATDVT
jgi:hypothetical protein